MFVVLPEITENQTKVGDKASGNYVSGDQPLLTKQQIEVLLHEIDQKAF